MFVYNLSVIPLCVKQPNLTVDLSRLFRLRRIFSAIFNRVVGPERTVSQNIYVRQGLGREPQQAEKYTRSASAVRVIFRVCGNKGIACTVAFVYTQALLAP